VYSYALKYSCIEVKCRGHVGAQCTGVAWLVAGGGWWDWLCALARWAGAGVSHWKGLHFGFTKQKEFGTMRTFSEFLGNFRFKVIFVQYALVDETKIL
jgi:hypothetical protein